MSRTSDVGPDTAVTVIEPAVATKTACPAVVHAVLPTDTGTVDPGAGIEKPAVVTVTGGGPGGPCPETLTRTTAFDI